MLDLEFVEVSFGSFEYQKTLDLRDKILRRPLGLVLEITASDLEPISYHLAAIHQGELVACLVLKPISDKCLKLRQMAVCQDFQGKKIGSRLVRFAEDFARQRAYTHIELHARLSVSQFYQNLGYTPYGDVFEEVTIDHQAFAKQLT